MTDEHQNHDQDQGDDNRDVDRARELSSDPTPDYGAPWLPISPPRDRS